MNLVLLLLCDDFGGSQGSHEIPFIGLIMMLAFALLLIWYKNRRNLTSKTSLSTDATSLLIDKDVLGFEKGNNENAIIQTPREITAVGKVLAVMMALLFLCIPVYILFERIMY